MEVGWRWDGGGSEARWRWDGGGSEARWRWDGGGMEVGWGRVERLLDLITNQAITTHHFGRLFRPNY